MRLGCTERPPSSLPAPAVEQLGRATKVQKRAAADRKPPEVWSLVAPS